MNEAIQIDPQFKDALRALYNRLLTPVKSDGQPPHYEVSLQLGRELREAFFDVAKG